MFLHRSKIGRQELLCKNNKRHKVYSSPHLTKVPISYFQDLTYQHKPGASRGSAPSKRNEFYFKKTNGLFIIGFGDTFAKRVCFTAQVHVTSFQIVSLTFTCCLMCPSQKLATRNT